MTQQELYTKLYNNDGSFSETELTELNKINDEFPYFQYASFVLLKALYKHDDTNYKAKLAKAATNTTSRKSLFNFIYTEYNNLNISIKEEKSKIKSYKQKSSDIVEAPKPIKDKAGNEIKSKTDLMKEVKSNLDSISTKLSENTVKKTNTDNSSTKEIDKKEKVTTDNIKGKSSSTLKKTTKKTKPIDRVSSIKIVEDFIKKNPVINRPADKEYNEEIELAKNSLNEDYELVSETMAKLFIKQGHKEKAIKIYEKLILIYPEKNTYFAARISELNN